MEALVFSEECISLRNLLNNEQVASEALADPGVTDASEDVPQPAQVSAESRVTMNPMASASGPWGLRARTLPRRAAALAARTGLTVLIVHLPLPPLL